MISWKYFRGSCLHIALRMGVAQIFVGKIFVHRLRTTKSTKILSLENYPLYGMLCTFVTRLHVRLNSIVNYIDGNGEFVTKIGGMNTWICIQWGHCPLALHCELFVGCERLELLK